MWECKVSIVVKKVLVSISLLSYLCIGLLKQKK